MVGEANCVSKMSRRSAWCLIHNRWNVGGRHIRLLMLMSQFFEVLYVGKLGLKIVILIWDGGGKKAKPTLAY